MRFLSFLRKQLQFSKKEFNGILVLCLLILLVSVLPYLYVSKPTEYRNNITDFDQAVNDFYTQLKNDNSHHSFYTNDQEIEKTITPKQLFRFNPNNLPNEQWLALGLSIRQIKTIKNYEAKGGRFYKKEDLAKMYCLSKEDYMRLAPYIDIPTPTYPNKTITTKLATINKPLKIIELNSCDSLELLEIKGIGATFASRILKFRRKFGGFYQKEQLKEVFGIDSAKYEQIAPLLSVNDHLVQKTNINKAAFDDLKRYYPYLNYKQMNAILNYRQQHGLYNSADDLQKIILLDSKTIQKIKPYLSY